MGGWDLEKVTDEREIEPIGGKKEGGVEKGKESEVWVAGGKVREKERKEEERREKQRRDAMRGEGM